MTRLMRQHTLFSRLATSALLSGAATAVHAQDGAYIVEPWLGRYQAVKIQPGDQKIVAGGTAVVTNANNKPEGDVAVARYDMFGSPDAAYGSHGLVTIAGSWSTVSALTIQPDGKAVVTSSFGYDFRMNRLNSLDGSPDSSFAGGGSTLINIRAGADRAFGVGLQSTGKIVVAGLSTGSTTSAYNQSCLVARFTTGGVIASGNGGFGQYVLGKPAGYALTSFGAKYQQYSDLAVQSDDKLVAAGVIYPDGSTGQLVVVRYTATGSLDKTFNGKGYFVLAPAGISSGASSVALQPDGKIVVVGTSNSIDTAHDMFVARFNANGTLDTGFAGGNGYVRLDIGGGASLTSEDGNGVAIQPDGKIVVAGREFTSGVGDLSRVLVARLNANGTLDSTFGAGGFKLGAPLPGTGYHSFWGYAVALQSDGSIIVAGTDFWGTTSDTNHPLLMRFNP